MLKFDFACETISFALAISNWMLFELDLEFDEDDFEEDYSFRSGSFGRFLRKFFTVWLDFRY